MNKILPNQRDVILFIDDDKICHTMVELIIPNLTKYKIIGAYDGAEALELAKRYANNICLILSDIMLPDINGYEIFNKLQSNAKLSSVPFIFQSGLGSQEVALKENIKGDVQIIYKPYTQDDLLEAIDKALL